MMNHKSFIFKIKKQMNRSPGALATMPGSAMVIFGSKAIVNDAMSITHVKGTIITGAQAGNQFGDAVGAAGDFNLDGIPDLTVGAPSAGTNGDVYVLYGQGGHYLNLECQEPEQQ